MLADRDPGLDVHDFSRPWPREFSRHLIAATFCAVWVVLSVVRVEL